MHLFNTDLEFEQIKQKATMALPKNDDENETEQSSLLGML